MAVSRDQVPGIEWDPIMAAIADTPRQYAVMIEQADDDEFYEKYGPQARQRTFIYVVQEEEAGPIKIGLASNIETRVCSLQTGNPRELRLLLAIEGDRSVERRLHRQAKPYQLRGEWFRPEPGMLALIEKLRESPE